MTEISTAPSDKPLGIMRKDVVPRFETSTVMTAKWESPLMLLTGFIMGTVFTHLSIDWSISHLTFDQLAVHQTAVRRLVGYYNFIYDPLTSPLWFQYGVRVATVALGAIFMLHYWTKSRKTLLDITSLMCLFVSLRQVFAYVISQTHVFLQKETVEAAATGDWDEQLGDDLVVAIQATTVGHFGVFVALAVFAAIRMYQLYAGRTYFDRQYDREEEERRLKHEGVPVFPNEYARMQEELRRTALQGDHQTIRSRIVKPKST